jgi:pilus assembly protein CpaC
MPFASPQWLCQAALGAAVLSTLSVWPAAGWSAPTAAQLTAPTVAAKPSPRSGTHVSGQPDIQTQGPVQIAPSLRLTAGKSMLLQLPENAARLSVGNPEVADVVLINPREIYLLGKKTGLTNLLVWTAQGSTTLRDIAVGADTDALHAKLQEYVPSAAFHGSAKIINLLRVHGTQQVMLEVKVAEVSKTLLDELGVDVNLTRTFGNTSVNLLSQLLSAGSTALTAGRANGLSTVTLTAEMKKGLVKVLAEPTITAVSGQEGSFLAGGKIYIPIPQTTLGGGTIITLQEKEFGVGLKFLPTVLEDGLINLQVTPEVSELSQVGTVVKGLGNQSSLLPTITTRRASTTVQLRDGESFAIGGLVKNNVTQTIKAFPVLGELPVLGALFRSTAFQTDKSELIFVVTPRLAKVLPPDFVLPTDTYVPPKRSEYFLEGRVEGKPPTPVPTAPVEETPPITE